MAALSLSSFSLLFFFLFFHSFAGKVAPDGHHLTVELAALLPSAACSRRSAKGVKKEDSSPSLEVVHRHGPCAGASKAPSEAEIFVRDQARVDLIHSKFSEESGSGSVQRIRPSKATKIPAKSGATIGSGNYIVSVGLGTPKKELSLIFDTGSDLTWTQCEPCARYCYSQKDPVFAPSKSTSYSNISCSSPSCSQLESGTGNEPGCSSATKSCIYGIQYGDQSFSVGYFAKETLSLSSYDVIENFLFGCGQNNRGLFGSAAGLLGLGQDKISIVKQTAQKYGQIFSYCLPKTASSTGYLTFGGGGNGGALKYTPITKAHGVANFYGLDVVGIKVGGTQLPISSSVFSTSGAIIDSGTVITRLPPAAYDALKSAFQKGMTAYPKAPELSILDTCYDLSKYTSVDVPKVSFLFKGGTELDLDAIGILYGASPEQVCLAFAGNQDPRSVAIIGNVQQKSLQVVYDVGGGRVGFGYNGC
ncbi:aspartyl protease family protein At5g10770-like isoform X2 [Momordica charantia]|uniref:Aspartyl protease family protein At5g10770-like isoform X2 n=1 Tax=Momordica charantia TaxID=3673 RepID=A0A6J1CBZ3_MOMCH|nr:aspartyl protease family protein At5g10770-like isoform X2 [Momordica charantia]